MPLKKPVAPERWRLSVAPMLDRCEKLTMMRFATSTCALRVHIVFARTALLAMFASVVPAAAEPVFIHGDMTLRAYSVECQRPATKLSYESRLSACTSYVRGAVDQIARGKRSPDCWEAIEAGKASPALVDAVLFHMATNPADANRPLGDALRWVVENVAAKACR